MDEKDFLLAMYSEQRTYARQHENLRATATNLTFISGAVLTSLLFKEGQPIVNRHALAVLLIGVGVFGFFLALKHYERHRYHISISHLYRDELEKLIPESNLHSLRKTGSSLNRAEFPIFSRVRLYWLWSCTSLVFAVIGLAYFLVVKI